MPPVTSLGVHRWTASPPGIPPTTPGSAPVVIGKVYMMGLEFPAVLNSKSFTALPPRIEDWHTADSQRTWHTADSQRTGRSNIKAVCRWFGVVLFWDPSTNIAVVLVGTKAPEQAHRVVVVQVGDGTSSSVPTQSYFVDIPPNFGAVTLFALEIAKLRALHEGYWTGLRYTDDGGSYYLGAGGVGGAGGGSGGSGGGGADDYEECEDGGEHFVQVLSQFSLNILPPKDYSGALFSSDDVHNPIHVPSGMRYSAIIAKMSDEEDFPASQIELMEGSYTTTGDPPQIRYNLMEFSAISV